MATRTLTVLLAGDAKGATKALEQGTSGFAKLGKAAALAGVAGVAAIGALAVKGVQNFAKLESQLSEVRTLLPDLSDEGFGKLRDDVIAFSDEMNVATDEAIPALYQAISAGVPQENALEFLKVASKAAIGGVTDLETAVDGITTVMNAFGDSAGDATAVSDQMFTAVRLGKTTFEELSSSIFNVAPLAAAAGVGFDEITAGLARLTAQGVPTAVATTQLRAAIQSLAAPSEGGKKVLDELGLSFDATTLAEEGLEGAFNKLYDATGGNIEQLKAVIGSVEGVQAVLGLTGPNAEAFASALDEVRNSSGATEAAFDTMSNTLSFRWEKTMNRVNNVMTKFGIALLPLVEGALDSLIPVIEQGATALSAQMGPAIQRISEWVQTRAVPAFQMLVEQFKTHVVPAIQLVVEWLKENVPPAMQAVSGFITGTLVPAFQAVSAWMVETGIPAIQNLVLWLKENIPPAMAAVSVFITGTLVPAFKAVSAWITETGVPAVQNLVLWLQENIPPAMAAVSAFITGTLVPAFKDVSTFITETFIPAIEKLVGWLKESVPPAIEAATEWFNTYLLPALEAIKTFIVETLIPAVTNAIETVVAFVTDNWSEIETLLTQPVEQAINTIETIFEVGRLAIEAILLAIVGDWEGVWEKIDGILASFKDFFEQTWDNIKTIWETAFGLLDTAAGGAFSSLAAKPGEFVDEMVASVKALLDVGQSFIDAGKDFGTKLIDSIMGMLTGLRDRVHGAIRNAISGIGGIISGAVGSAISSARSRVQSFVSGIGIPGLQHGGIVPATPGGRIVRVAEGGQAEAIVPLNRLRGGGGMGGNTYNLYIDASGGDPERIAEVIFPALQSLERDGAIAPVTS